MYILLHNGDNSISQMFWVTDSWSLWIVPSDPKTDNTLTTLLEKIRDKLPNHLPRLTPTHRLLVFLVLLLLSVIILLTLAPRPSPPTPPSSTTSPTPPPIKPGNSINTGVQSNPGGGVSFSWLTNFLSNNYISIILLLFLAILAVLWRSMIGDSSIFHLLFVT